MSFYANVDGGGEVLIGSFRGNNASYLYKDDNLNGTIDAGETTVLTSAFSEYTFNISGVGSSLVITIKCLLSTMNEEGAYDNIRVLGTDALPVELISFTANTFDSNIALNWQTATEVNNYGFEVERSMVTDQQPIIKWEKIGFVAGSGNSNSPKKYSFVDTNPIAGSVKYRLKQINFDGSFTYYSRLAEVNNNLTDVNEKQLPAEFALEQNYPNPFNPVTSIKYSVGSAQYVSLKVYNILGDEVAELVNETKSPGYYEVKFNAVNLAAGIYFYKLTAGSFTSTKKLILLK